MDMTDNFDLVGALHNFLHHIGLLPLQSASSTKISAARSPGTVTNHHLGSDISPDDWNFLLRLVNINLSENGKETYPQLTQDPIPRFLEILARVALLPPFTRHVSCYFIPVLPELASRWILSLHFQDDGRYSDYVSSHWPTQLGQNVSTSPENSLKSSQQRENIKSSLRPIINAFSLLLPHHPSLFPLFLVLMRHPALTTDPFNLLPEGILPHISTLDTPLPENHPLYQSELVGQLLLTISRLLLVSPHLPYPGLVLRGWALPPTLLNILKFHPRRGTRQLAWHCWKFWQGPAHSSRLIKDVRDQYVWRRNSCDRSLIEDNFTSPWLEQSPRNLDTNQDTTMSSIADSSSNDLIKIEEQLTFKWNIQMSGSSIPSTFSYEVVFREIDAWVMEFDETDRILQLESHPKSAPVQRNVDLRPLFLQNFHLTKLIAGIEGQLILKFHALPRPAGSIDLLPAAPNSMPQQVKVSGREAIQHETAFVATSSSLEALRSASRYILERFPVLISGPPSSGKNTIIQKLAAHLWSRNLSHDHSIIDQSEFDQNVVILNLASRTLDAKSLVGSYVSSTEDPGKFVFVEGPLLRAMKEGKWLVCQDIDRASDDVLSVINQLADLISHRAQHEIGGGYGGHGGLNGVGIDLGAQSGWVPANERFLLLATRTCHHEKGKSFVGEQYWKEVAISSMTKEDILNVVTRQTPNFSENVRDRLVSAWEEVSSSQIDASRKRPIQLTDLLKWVARIKGLLSKNQALSSVSQNPVLQEQIFLEGFDLFLASSENLMIESEDLTSNIDLAAAQALGKHLDLNSERSTYCVCRRIPDFIPTSHKNRSGSSAKSKTYVTIGRTKHIIDGSHTTLSSSDSRPFALTKSTLVLLERLAVCMRSSEPTLLVGETGTGKTTVVSYLAKLLGKKLISLNLSNQSEASDLLGGFKPLDSNEDAKLHSNRLVDTFLDTFGNTFNTTRNHEFVHAIRKAASKKKYIRLVALLKDGIRALSERLNSKAKQDGPLVQTDIDDCHEPPKRRKTNRSPESNQQRLNTSMQDYLFSVNQFEDKFIRSASNHMRFRFVEGPLVKALQQGDWVLLDEINLGTTETLEALSGLLRHPNASVVLSERGDLVPVPRHPDFRLIGCMNPATDVGKRDLPSSLRSKFTELYVQPPDNDREALLNIIAQHLGGLCLSDKKAISDAADCYSAIRTLARNGSLADGTNAPPHYSMRTLSRALSFASQISSSLCLRRALVEGFLMAFVTTLDAQSTEIVYQLIDRHIVKNGKNPKAIMSQLPKKPEDQESYIQVGPFWLKKAQVLDESVPTQDYVLTESVKSKIIDLARAVTTGKYPVLIQGPTSSGKTSIVAYIARLTGHPFVRINNHEHTDIQEYIGSYAPDPETGRLCFKEGALVRALRQGAWVVLDELNLAPSDVLEALNRLLDDNRELLIPETQEVVKPHPDFMLFATQNPPGLYGGRKVLSRAFRNRFIELHFDDVPKDELEVILCQRCAIAPSHANKIVQVFAELQRRRQRDKIFEQKHSFVTLRDLFRWGGRGALGYQELAEDGYMLLAERSRGEEEKATVKQVLEDLMNVTINPDSLYQDVTLPEGLVATNACKRLFKLVSRCLQFNEPVLLVGDAGSGKTSVCEALSSFANQRLRSVNLHRNSEVGDLLGSQRPIRQRAEKIRNALEQLRTSVKSLDIELTIPDGSDIDDIISNIEQMLAERLKSTSDSKTVNQVQTDLTQLKKSTALFDWSDGPLIQAMREGDYVLLDEISLADDSVLERLNSLLEPERSIVLAERGGESLEKMQITAHESFQIFATMNPGGDFGKKELSPALRNRFTEIWVPLVSDPHDRLAIYVDRLSQKSGSGVASSFIPYEWAARIISFSDFYSKSPISAQFSACELSLRDGLAWCDFMASCSSLPPPLLFIHGAQMTVLDRLGTAGFGQDLPSNLIHELRSSCLDHLHQLANISQDAGEGSAQITYLADGLKIGDFILNKSTSILEEPTPAIKYSFQAQTVAHNAMRIVRALQVPKAVLLEGSPGVGKTSIVEAIANLTGRQLQRINLSDQTDLLDLFGADAPVEGGMPGQFEWKDASFLDALQKGDWVLLDEMNLAPQTVLEGLNCCLDHRGTVYIPEIDRTFKRHPDFRVFAAQNPHHQGGSRKGLPRSLVDRFTVVFMKEMEKEDLLQICTEMAPTFDRSAISQMVNFNIRLAGETNSPSPFASLGSPWEFNLRDLGRWLQITSLNGQYDLQPLSPVEYLDTIYTGRFRTQADQATSLNICRQFFNASSMSRDHQDMVELPSELVIGHSRLEKPSQVSWTPPMVAPLKLPACLFNCSEALIRCLEVKWLPILTGSERSGKSSLVKFLAARKGVHLRVISLHSGTDTSDLIGGFEQSNAERKLIKIIEDICRLIESNLEKSYVCRDAKACSFDESLRDLYHVKSLVSSHKVDALTSCVLQVLRQLGRDQFSGQFETLEHSLLELETGKSGCRFEWVDGPLVTAMKKGQWLLVENSNRCSASVLDRLNPLFEGVGRLQLAEKGMTNRGIDTVTPHDDFRIIFAFNPRYGELSRAMRNRGVEIAFLPDAHFTGLRLPMPLHTTPITSAENIQDSVMRWTAQALIHSPTEYPLLSRTLDHYLPSSSPDHTLKLLLDRLLQSDIKSVVSRWAEINRATHFFIGKAFDLAIGCQSTQHLLDQDRSICHQFVLRLVIAACLPLRLLSHRSNLKSNDPKTMTRESTVKSSHQIDPAHLSTYVNHASDSVLQACLLVLSEAQENRPVSHTEASKYQMLFECIRDIQEGTVQLIDLLDSSPDHAAIGFALKMIDDAINRAPAQSAGLFASTYTSLQPLRDSHDISRWEALVLLWNLFCPPWYKNLKLVRLIDQLAQLSEANWSLLDTDLRAIYFEIVAALKISQEISIQCPDISWLTDKLKQQISTAEPERIGFIELETSADESFGIVGEKMVSIVAIMATFLEPEKGDKRIAALIPQWGSLPSEVGVLFRSKAYLQDHNASTDQIDLCLNLQIVRLLTAPPINFCDLTKAPLKPFNVLSQFTRANFLPVMSGVSRLVKTSTSLACHGTVVSTLDRLVSLVATTSASLNADRACLCLSLISKLLDFVETPVVHLQDSLANQPDITVPSGLSFCIRALRLWSLYIPDIPIDPLSVQTAHHSYLQAWASRLCQLRDFLVSYQEKDVRLPSNARVSQLNEEIAAIQLRCKEIPQPSIQRSTDTLVQHAIFTELKAFEKQFLVDGRLENLCSDLVDPRDHGNMYTLHARIENFSFSAIGLIHRLTRRFPTSVDILWPVQAFLNIMIADLTLTFQRAVARLSNPSTRVIADFIGLLTTTTTAVAAANLRENANLERVQAAITDEASQSSMSLLCISAMSKYSIDEFDDSQTLKLLSFYDKIWNLWTRDCMRQQKEAEEKAQEFKTRRQDIIIKSDEEIEEEELRALFPSHEENTPRSSPNSSANLITPAQISMLCEMHLSMMSGEVDQAHSPSCFDSLRQQLVVAIVERHGHTLPSILDQSSLGFQFHSLCQLLKTSDSLENSKANFYTDGNTTETTRVVPLINGLASRINVLIQQWPEMTTLDEVLQRCRKILALSSDSPLALIIPQLEALIGQIEEWQKYSCSENSLLSFQSELTTLVVSWRRLELKSWAALIQTELDTFESTTDIWWFRLYELLVRGFMTHAHSSESQETKSYLKDCAVVLNQFITECNLGQFGSRLSLLKSFDALLKAASRTSELGCWTKVTDLLDGIIYFYSHHKPQVNQKIEQAKSLARGEIEKYIQLASWKDVNIIALRQSSQKSHRHLYKTVRKFRNVLQGPVTDLLQRWQVKKSGDIEAHLPKILQNKDLPEHNQFELASWTRYTQPLSMPSYFSQPQNVLKRLQNLVESNNFLSHEVSNAASEIDLLSTHIFSVAKELAEVKIPQGDGRERFARNLDLRKRKAFSELLKKLRALGIGTTPTDRLLAHLSDPAVVMSQPLLGPESFPEVKLCGEDSDELLFALLNEMPQFRKYRSQHHSDVPNADMERLVGSIESGLSLILEERQTLSALINTIKPVEKTLLRMSNLMDSSECCPSKTTGNQLRDMSKRINQHQKLCVISIAEASESIIQLSDRREGRKPTATSEVLQELIETVVENQLLAKQIAEFSGTSLTLLKPNETEGLRKVSSNFKRVTDRLESLDSPNFEFIILPLAQQLSNHQITIPTWEGASSCSSEKAWMSLKKLSDLILVVIQALTKTNDPQVNLLQSKKAPGLLRKAHSEFVRFTEQCHLAEILQNLTSFSESLSFSQDSEEISLLLKMAASFLKQYLRLISNHLLGYIRWHRSNLHLLHTIISIGANIAEQGFCKPDFSEEEEDSSGKDGPSRDGTGLGGGQGAKDVSEEIEDDEQLEGLQGEVEEEKRETDQDASKEDKAVETQQEFDAPLEDIENADENDSNASEDQEGEDEEVEDGVGKVDPLDSGAVDEKFWEGGDEAGDEPETNEAELSAKENQPMPQDSDLTAQENTAGGEQNKAKKADDQDVASPQENDGSDVDDQLSDGGSEKDDLDQPDDAPDAEENQNDNEVPLQDNTVPMMSNVDNAEVLDLPEDLELEDRGSEAGENSVQDSIMDLEDSVPEPAERHDTEADEGVEEETSLNQDNDDRQPEQALDEPQSQNVSSGQTKDDQSGAGAGSEGGGAHSTAAELNPADNLDKPAENEPPHMDAQDLEGAPKVSAHQEPAHAKQSKSTQQVGDGTDGQAVSQEQSPTDNSDDAKKDPARPNPLRNLGNAMEDWKQRLQQIIDAVPGEGKDRGEEQFDETAEVEYLHTDDDDLTHQQAPGPATEEQACEGIVNMQIDDCEPQVDIPRPPTSHSTPLAAEPLQAPETGDQSGLSEAAILGTESKTVNDDKMQDLRFEKQPSDDQDEQDELVEPNKLNPETGPLHDSATSLSLWRQYQQLTSRSASHLTEQLRLILEPTTATCLQGDYRTGKRLNMRKLIPYIASDYTKDRIWLRRTKPAQRDYKILLAVDDSKSMADSRCADLAFQTLALVTSALAKLEVGEVAIAKFGGSFDILQPFEGGSGKLNNLISPIEGFTFSQQQTNVRLAVAKAVEAFSLAQTSGHSHNNGETWKLGIIISDGICQDHDEVRSLLRKASEDKIMFVFLILDSLHQHTGTTAANQESTENKDNHQNDSSIISMNSVSYVNGPHGQMELKMERYLDSFPFDYYIILRDVEALPNILSSTLRQFLEKVNNV